MTRSVRIVMSLIHGRRPAFVVVCLLSFICFYTYIGQQANTTPNQPKGPRTNSVSVIRDLQQVSATPSKDVYIRDQSAWLQQDMFYNLVENTTSSETVTSGKQIRPNLTSKENTAVIQQVIRLVQALKSDDKPINRINLAVDDVTKATTQSNEHGVIEKLSDELLEIYPDLAYEDLKEGKLPKIDLLLQSISEPSIEKAAPADKSTRFKRPDNRHKINADNSLRNYASAPTSNPKGAGLDLKGKLLMKDHATDSILKHTTTKTDDKLAAITNESDDINELIKSLIRLYEANNIGSNKLTRERGPTVDFEALLSMLSRAHNTLDYPEEPDGSMLQVRPKPDDDATIVLLVTYARSGSTWLGSILAQATDSIYVNEPLFHVIQEGYYTHDSVCYNNNTCRAPRRIVEMPEFAMTSLLRLFTCQFSKLPDQVINNLIRSIRKSDNWHILEKCDIGGNEWRECLRKLQKVCLNSRFRIFKTIRLSMDVAETLMRLIPKMKIIHLIRDPRGITNSRNHGNFAMSRDIISHSISLCSRMRNDVNASKNIGQAFPGRITTIFYEALASRPYDGTEFIFQFIGSNITASVIQWVYESVHAQTKNKTRFGYYFDTKRENSELTSSQWRHDMELVNVRVIDAICMETYDGLGFLPFKILADLHDLKRPSRHSLSLINGFS